MSKITPLFVPKRFAKTKKKVAANPGLVEHPGRKVGSVAGSWIYDLVALHKTIVLCWACAPKFDYKTCHYHKDTRFPFVQGKCDGCRKLAMQGKLFIHQSLLGTASGCSWEPE